jgi:hypothetical protein
MTGISIEEQRKRSEFITQARQLVNKEHMSKCAVHHQQWVTGSELAWRTNGALLPYPTPALYPSEEEIVAKALELYNAATPQIKSNPPPLPEVPPLSPETFNPNITATVTAQLQAISTPVTASVQSDPAKSLVEPEIVEPEIVEPEIVEPEIVEPAPALVADTAVQPIVAKNSLLRNVLSGWLQKNKDKET